MALAAGVLTALLVSSVATSSAAAATFPHPPLAYSRVTSAPEYDWYPAWSRDGSRLAFVRYYESGSSYHNDLFTIRTDGSAEQRLTTDDNVFAPSWSPDGRRIVYSAYVGGAPMGDTHVYAVDADGTARTDLTPNEAGAHNWPAWSPTGDVIAYTGPDGGLWTMMPDGSHKTEVAPNGKWPAWSSDGQRLSFVTDTGSVRVTDPTGLNGYDLATPPGMTIGSPPAWSRDGHELAYAASTDASSVRDIVVVDATTGTALFASDTPSVDEDWPSFSPVADALALSADRDASKADIYIARQGTDQPPPPPGGGGGGTPAPCPVTPRTDGQPVGVTIDGARRYTNHQRATLTIVAPDAASSVVISNDGGFGDATSVAVRPSKRYAWMLLSTGPERLPKTVYVRFAGACLDPSQTISDDIVLDETAPSVRAASVTGPRTRAGVSAARLHRYRIRSRAKDRTSGVGMLQAAIRKRRPLELLRYRRIVDVRASRTPRWVRVRDRAGNWSFWTRLHRAAR